MSSHQTPEWHPAFEEYCETIFDLAETDVKVIQARIADRLGFSRPAVSEMIARLQAADLVHISDSEVILTDAGKQLAEQVTRRHRLAERFLTDVLQMSWTAAHAEAGRWEHVISDSVEAAMTRVLNNPTTCPHGNPIPGSGYESPTTIPLSDVPVGIEFTVQQIPEELEVTPGQLEFLERWSMRPGQTGSVMNVAPDGSLTVAVADHLVGIGSFASHRILVTV